MKQASHNAMLNLLDAYRAMAAQLIKPELKRSHHFYQENETFSESSFSNVMIFWSSLSSYLGTIVFGFGLLIGQNMQLEDVPLSFGSLQLTFFTNDLPFYRLH